MEIVDVTKVMDERARALAVYVLEGATAAAGVVGVPVWKVARWARERGYGEAEGRGSELTAQQARWELLRLAREDVYADLFRTALALARRARDAAEEGNVSVATGALAGAIAALNKVEGEPALLEDDLAAESAANVLVERAKVKLLELRSRAASGG